MLMPVLSNGPMANFTWEATKVPLALALARSLNLKSPGFKLTK